MAVGMFGPEVILNGRTLSPLPMPSTAVTVKNPDNSAATLYTDATGSVSTGTNIVSTDSRGQLAFFAAPGYYLLSFADSVGSQSLTVSVPNTAATDSATYRPAHVVVGTGIDPTGVADSTTAVQAILTAASDHGIVEFPAGTFKITSTLTMPNGVTVRGAGLGATTLAFSGSGYCLDHPTLDSSNGFVIEDLYITCTSAATGAIRLGNYATALTGYFGKSTFRNLYLYGPGPSDAGSVGFMASQVASSLWSNVHIQGFETGLVMDRTTANVLERVTIQTCYYGAHWTGQATPAACGQDTTFYLEVLGPDSGCPADAYCLKVDAPNLTMNSPYYEMGPGAVAKCVVWLTTNANAYREVAGRWQPTSGSTNTLLADADASTAVFVGTWLSASGGAAPASSIAAPGTGGGYNGNHMFIGCDTRLTATLTAALTSGYAQVIGQGYVDRSGSPILQIPAIQGKALALPSHIYSDPADAMITASATQDSGTAGKASAGSGAGTSPPTPVVTAGSNDRRGRISFGTGTAAGGNPVLRVNFAVPYNTAPYVVLADSAGSAAAVKILVSTITTDYFLVSVDGGVPASQPNTAYLINYMVEA